MTEAPLWIKGRLGTSLYYPLIILQSRNFVNSQNAQMMKKKFFLSNNKRLCYIVFLFSTTVA